MGLIIRICKSALAGCVLWSATAATATNGDAIDEYAVARLAEISNRNDQAVKAYWKLYRRAPASEILADRLFDTAIRSGDMVSAVRAARGIELRSAGSSSTALLLFADAFRTENWDMAVDAADRVALDSNFAFMAPILTSWVRVAQGKAAGLPDSNSPENPFFSYYSSDQRIYLQLAAGDISAAKYGLRAIAVQPDEYVHELLLASAGSVAASGDTIFADALARSAWQGEKSRTMKYPTGRLAPPTGLSALYRRIAIALTEQDVEGQGLLMARIAAWIAPQSDPNQIALARTLAANDLPDEALAILARVHHMSPFRAKALETSIRVLSEQGRSAESVVIANNARQMSPDSADAQLLHARAYEAADNLPAAIDIYRTLVSVSANSNSGTRRLGNYRLLLASALDRSGDWSNAMRELEKIVATEPNNSQVLNYLGYSMLERGIDLERATGMVKRAYDIDPTSGAITDSLGYAYYLNGDVAKALPLLEKAAKTAGNDVAVNEHLGDAYWALGRRRDARYAWNTARQAADGDGVIRLAAKIDFGPVAAFLRP